jgi:hypothetical protein
MLMLLFGAGYVVRGVDLFQKSRWLHKFGPGRELPDNGAVPKDAWSGGAANALACGIVGTCGVLLSYFVAQQLKQLRLAMRVTKSLKSR